MSALAIVLLVAHSFCYHPQTFNEPQEGGGVWHGTVSLLGAGELLSQHSKDLSHVILGDVIVHVQCQNRFLQVPVVKGTPLLL